MLKVRNWILKNVLLIGLLAAFAYAWAQPINLVAVDIGRHIKNGELLLNGQTQILYKNFYSFTYPQYPFINHHWFFGVLSFLGFKAFGFEGLSIAYVAILVLGLVFFILAARRYGDWSLVFFLTALGFCVISDRKEIRPEGISALLLGIYFYLLTRFHFNDCSKKLLLSLLIPLQILWVNTHIFFILGPVLILIFLWKAHIDGQSVDKKKTLQWALFLSCVLNLLNPSGIWGALTPFHFQGFGYNLAENQTVFFMMHRFPNNIFNYWSVLLTGIAIVGAGFLVWRQGFKKALPILALLVITLFAGLKAVRLMPFFALVFIPLGTIFFEPYVEGSKKWIKVSLICAGIGLVLIQNHFMIKGFGLGLTEGVNNSAEFFKGNHLPGPIFSNYDIGGYLIYHLAPEEKVFVDNRQEAFPPDFFKDIYIPMQADSSKWQEMLNKFSFKSIYFHRNDLTPWGQQFLINRIDDPQWAPVYVDAYVIIFLRRLPETQDLIQRYQLPREMFGVTKQQA